ncbi:MAG TPA: hypothetical protein VH702_10390 [Vicinamibacterales bacterium]|jgi:hypothetical protein
MTKITRALVQLCALAAATLAMQRSSLPAQAEACVSCVTDSSCQDTSGGVTKCWVETTCKQNTTECTGS